MKALNYVVGTAFALALLYALRAPVAPPKGNVWFDTVIAQESRPVLVKFGAEWCGPCRHMDEILDNYTPRGVKVVRIDIDEKPELADHYGVHSIPRLFIMKQGYAVAKHGGFGSAEDLQGWIDSQL